MTIRNLSSSRPEVETKRHLSKRSRSPTENVEPNRKHPINPSLAVTREDECLSCLGRHRPHTCGRQGRRGRLPGSLSRKQLKKTLIATIKEPSRRTRSKVAKSEVVTKTNIIKEKQLIKVKEIIQNPKKQKIKQKDIQPSSILDSEKAASSKADLPIITSSEEEISLKVFDTLPNSFLTSSLESTGSPLLFEHPEVEIEDENSMMDILWEDYMKDFVTDKSKTNLN